MAVRELHLATTLVFCFSDGSVEFRSRSTLDLLPHDEADRVSSMAQVGLEFLPGDPCKYGSVNGVGSVPDMSKFYTRPCPLVPVLW